MTHGRILERNDLHSQNSQNAKVGDKGERNHTINFLPFIRGAISSNDSRLRDDCYYSLCFSLQSTHSCIPDWLCRSHSISSRIESSFLFSKLSSLSLSLTAKVGSFIHSLSSSLFLPLSHRHHHPSTLHRRQDWSSDKILPKHHRSLQIPF